MAIANELSSDVAAAVLTHKDNKVQADRKELSEIVRNFYSALRPLTIASRRQRLRASLDTQPPSPTPSSRAVSSSK
jgi:hypothetical protein